MIVEQIVFRVRKDRTREFEKHADAGLRLLLKTRGFITQVLMRNADDPGEYRAMVRWVSRDYRDRFRGRDDAETRALQKDAAALLEAAPAHSLLEEV